MSHRFTSTPHFFGALRDDLAGQAITTFYNERAHLPLRVSFFCGRHCYYGPIYSRLSASLCSSSLNTILLPESSSRSLKILGRPRFPLFQVRNDFFIWFGQQSHELVFLHAGLQLRGLADHQLQGLSVMAVAYTVIVVRDTRRTAIQVLLLDDLVRIVYIELKSAMIAR